MTSTSFLKALSAGDTAAWKIAYLYYWGMSFMWARREGCTEQEAEDVAQAAMMKIYQHAGSFDHPGVPFAFRGWLKTVVKNLAIDTFRDRLDPVGSGDTTFVEAGGVAVGYSEKVIDEQLAGAISRLISKKTGMRVLAIRDYLLKALSGKSVEEIAEHTQTPRSTIYQRVYRASHALPEKLARLEVESFKEELIALLNSDDGLKCDADFEDSGES